MKSKSSDIVGVTLKRQDGSRISRLDVVKLDSMVSSSSKEALVWRYAQAVDLRVWMWDCAAAYA